MIYVFSADDLFSGDRRDDFAYALRSSRTRELVRSRTSATKSGEIRQMRKAADLLDTSSFRAADVSTSSIDQEGVSDLRTSIVSVNESISGHVAASQSGNDSSSCTENNTSSGQPGILQHHSRDGCAVYDFMSSTPAVRASAQLPARTDLPRPVVSRERQTRMSASTSVCTCSAEGNSFFTQAANCLMREDIGVCLHCLREAM